MPVDLAEQMYCSQQILIPPSLPSMLKNYAKAAIRTQPKDLLLWSLHYFKALADGVPPPVKERIEYPPIETESGLTPGYLKVLLKQIGNVEFVQREIIFNKWEGICLERKHAEFLINVGNFKDEVEWMKFVAIAAGTIEKDLTGTMSLLCEILTEEPEGCSSIIPVEKFLNLYKYLAELDCGPTLQMKTDSGGVSTSEEKPEPSAEEEPPEIWDTLLKDVGDQKSDLTVATDDIKDLDSHEGLQVWPDLVPKELKLADNVDDSLNPDDVLSDTGVPVWDDEQLKENTGVIEVIEPKVKTGATETLEATSESVPETLENIIAPQERQEVVVYEEVKTGELPEKAGSTDLEEGSEEMKDVMGGEETVEEEEEVVATATLVEPNPEMIMMPSPVPSKESLCTEEKSVESVGDIEREPSTGQVLKLTTSLRDVKVKRKETYKEMLPSECPPEKNFRADIPGIGPPVPLEALEKVEVYLRQCAAKQCGMVMPRNLRHFLCPPLDSLQKEEYIDASLECVDCAKDMLTEREMKLMSFCVENPNNLTNRIFSQA